MRGRILRVSLVIATAFLLAAAVGCGGDGGGDQSTPSTEPAQTPPSDNAFPTNGTTTGPNVITTPGTTAKKEPGQAGGGSSGTCIGSC